MTTFYVTHETDFGARGPRVGRPRGGRRGRAGSAAPRPRGGRARGELQLHGARPAAAGAARHAVPRVRRLAHRRRGVVRPDVPVGGTVARVPLPPPGPLRAEVPDADDHR